MEAAGESWSSAPDVGVSPGGVGRVGLYGGCAKRASNRPSSLGDRCWVNITVGLAHPENYVFGPFELRAPERLLLHEGVQIALGSRAMDVLLCLIERAGEVVGQDELLDLVWQGVTVEPAALRVHLSTLRKALAEADPEASYVSNVAGRGYSFVGPVGRVPATEAHRSGVKARARLGPASGRVVGRDRVVDDLQQLSTTERVITLVGPAGVGKTMVALSLGRRRYDAFDGNVVFVDLAQERSDGDVASVVASALQLADAQGNGAKDLVERLRPRRMLLILDSCEHVIAGAAALVEAIQESTPRVHVLATSREPLNLRREQVRRLSGLETPPEIALSFDQVCTYAAARVFVDCVSATGCQLTRGQDDARLVGEICRRLDGIPLALELAAGRVDAFGLAMTASLLESPQSLSWPGRRTAVPRHFTLKAALDWSFDLLSADEARLLRALSTFTRPFTLAAAKASADDDLTELATANLPGLVAKSLVDADPEGAERRYRLLHIIRLYAAARLAPINP